MPPKRNRSSYERFCTIHRRNNNQSFCAQFHFLPFRHAHEHFKHYVNDLKSDDATIIVKDQKILIAARTQIVLRNVLSTIQNEAKRFTENQKKGLQVLLSKKIIPVKFKHRGKTTKSTAKTKMLRPHFQTDRSSIHVNHIPGAKRRYYNKITNILKQSYKSRLKYNARFKYISKYFGELMRRRHRYMPFYGLPRKRSRIEYRKLKIDGRRRDRLKQKQRCSKANRSRRHVYKQPQNKKNQRIIDTMKCPAHASKLQRSTKTSKLPCSTIGSKLQCISIDNQNRMPKSKNKNIDSNLKHGCRSARYNFSFSFMADYASVIQNHVYVRYYNQEVYIYTKSNGRKRPSRKDLVATLSTLNGAQSTFDCGTNKHRSFTK